jgi:hypothetical protein
LRFALHGAFGSFQTPMSSTVFCETRAELVTVSEPRRALPSVDGGSIAPLAAAARASVTTQTPTLIGLHFARRHTGATRFRRGRFSG